MCVYVIASFCSLRACSHRQYTRHNRISVGFTFGFFAATSESARFFLAGIWKWKKRDKGREKKNISNFGRGRGEKNGRITCNPTLSIKRAINTAWVSLSVCSFRAATATETAITKQNNPRQWQQQNKKPKNTDDEFLFVTIFRNSHGLVGFLCGCVAPLTVTVVVYEALSFTSVSKSGTIASSWDVERNRTIERCEREAK